MKIKECRGSSFAAQLFFHENGIYKCYGAHTHTITITFIKFTYTFDTYVEFKQAYGSEFMMAVG